MSASVIGAQLYTLREFLKTPAEIAQTMKKVKKLGYDAVQCSGLGPIDAKELASILKGEGLKCAATHVSLDQLRNGKQIVEEHQMWGCQYTAIGGFNPKPPTAQLYLDFAKDYSQIARNLAASGLQVGYHNHSHELVKFDGTQALQLLIDKCDPAVWFEIDTYWITHGGGDPVQWIKKVSGRIPCVHFKDMGIKPDRTQFMAEVGEGNLNWPAIIAACKEAGTKWYLVEQDTCYRDPFESLGISLRNLRAMGLP